MNNILSLFWIIVTVFTLLGVLCAVVYQILRNII